MKCTNCGAENPEGRKFCGECGKKLEIAAPRMCVSCGRPIPFDAMICQYCGHDYRPQLSGPSTIASTPSVPGRPFSPPVPARVSPSPHLLHWAVVVAGLSMLLLAALEMAEWIFGSGSLGPVEYSIVSGVFGIVIVVLAMMSMRK